MTKDGKPSRINDIRLFHSGEKNLTSLRTVGPLEGQEDAVAFGRRMAWFLNGEEFSCGSYAALCIVFTPMLGPGEIKITDEAPDWWQRYVLIGAQEGFPNAPDAAETVKREIVSVLKAIRPDLTALVDHAEDMVRTHGDGLRFLMQVRKNKHNMIELYFNVPVAPQPAYLFTAFTKMPKGQFFEGPPLLIGSSGSPFDYNGPIKVAEVEKSFAEFTPKPRPAMSKPVRNRG